MIYLATRPQQALGHVHVQHVQQALGFAEALGADGTLDTLTKIARAFPSCFSSRSILPALERTRAFAGTITTAGLSVFGGTASPASVKKSIDDAIGKIVWWKDRLATEPVAVYCSNNTRQVIASTGVQAGPKMASGDYKMIQDAVLEPYRILYGIEGARKTVADAARGLYADLTLGFYDPLTGRFNVPTWAKAVVGGFLLLSVIKLVRR